MLKNNFSSKAIGLNRESDSIEIMSNLFVRKFLFILTIIYVVIASYLKVLRRLTCYCPNYYDCYDRKLMPLAAIIMLLCTFTII